MGSRVQEKIEAFEQSSHLRLRSSSPKQKTVRVVSFSLVLLYV
jgi:hypothetical protein